MSLEKYLPHIQNLIENPDKEISNFASDLATKAQQFDNGEITLEQFDDGNYLPVFDNDFDHIRQGKSSINYIKQTLIRCSSPQESSNTD